MVDQMLSLERDDLDGSSSSDDYGRMRVNSRLGDDYNIET